ncbi:MAG: hypothetical protein HYT94_02455 [Parcubacteria group bacterium]|nr:hypothetical protein [Parcubacteria group bacterium]
MNKQKKFIAHFTLTCAIAFLVLSVFGTLSVGPKEFTRQLGSAVSVSAGVASNEYNTIAQSLLEKEAEVNQREAALAERERAVMAGGERDTMLVATVLSVGFLLLFLILLNFYLDWRRKP